MPKSKKINLRKARLERGLTIEGLARKAGLNYSTVQSIESGRLKGSLKAKHALADALDVPVRLLMNDEEERMLLEFAGDKQTPGPGKGGGG